MQMIVFVGTEFIGNHVVEQLLLASIRDAILDLKNQKDLYLSDTSL